MRVAVELEIPADLSRFRLPAGVQARLQELLDRQDEGGTLTAAERQEADGLVNLAELLSLLKLRAERAGRGVSGNRGGLTKKVQVRYCSMNGHSSTEQIGWAQRSRIAARLLV